VLGEDGALPATFALLGNYPNPFNASTLVRFSLPTPSTVTLKVYDSAGQQVRTLYLGIRQAGYHAVRMEGEKLASGTYFYRLQAGNFAATDRMLLLK